MRWTRENDFDRFVQASADQENVPVALVKGLIGSESAFVPGAYRIEQKIGDASYGLTQILYGTARSRGYAGEPGSRAALTGLFDPATNIAYGVKHLAALITYLGSIEDALSAYNGGYRPELGFGRKATAPARVCLARDAAGNCTTWKDVQAGQYANQEYVDRVLANARYFAEQMGAVTAEPGGGGTAPGVVTSSLVPGGVLDNKVGLIALLAALGALLALLFRGRG